MSNVGRILRSSPISRTNPNLGDAAQLWDASHMSNDAPSPLQAAIRSAIAASGRARDHFDTQLQAQLGTKGKPLYDIDRGRSRKPSPDVLRAIETVLDLPADKLVNIVFPRGDTLPAQEPDQPSSRALDAGEIVQIIQLDLSLPMGTGATVDDYIEEEPRGFDLAYIRGFTRTPPHRLRIARGVGDSMFPTLQSADMVWIDSTQTVLNQADRIWAVSIHGAAAIKRLRRVARGKVLVVSDNPAVENYEVDEEDVLIGGRVIRFARDV